MSASLVQEFHNLLSERLDVQDVVHEAQNLLRLSRPVTSVCLLTKRIIWYPLQTATVCVISVCGVVLLYCLFCAIQLFFVSSVFNGHCS